MESVSTDWVWDTLYRHIHIIHVSLDTYLSSLLTFLSTILSFALQVLITFLRHSFSIILPFRFSSLFSHSVLSSRLSYFINRSHYTQTPNHGWLSVKLWDFLRLEPRTSNHGVLTLNHGISTPNSILSFFQLE